MDAAKDYPDDADLDEIRLWGFRQDDPVGHYASLMARVRGMWMMSGANWVQYGHLYKIATVGWSGNEALVDALRENPMFWGMCWVLSASNGLHVFCVDPGGADRAGWSLALSEISRALNKVFPRLEAK